MRPQPIAPVEPIGVVSMPDLLWLAILGGLFLATLAFVRLCDNA